MQDTVTVYRGKDNDWYWHRTAQNGKVVADSSEGYVNLEQARRMAIHINNGPYTLIEKK